MNGKAKGQEDVRMYEIYMHIYIVAKILCELCCFGFGVLSFEGFFFAVFTRSLCCEGVVADIYSLDLV